MPIFRVINPTDRHGFVDVLQGQRLERQIIEPHVETLIRADEAKAYSKYVTVETDEEVQARTGEPGTLPSAGSTRPPAE